MEIISFNLCSVQSTVTGWIAFKCCDVESQTYMYLETDTDTEREQVPNKRRRMNSEQKKKNPSKADRSEKNGQNDGVSVHQYIYCGYISCNLIYVAFLSWQLCSAKEFSTTGFSLVKWQNCN